MDTPRFRSTYIVVLIIIAAFVVSNTRYAIAAPIVNNDSGTWFDNYIDTAGVQLSNNTEHNAPARTIELAIGQTSGSYTTVLIRPTSFDGWEDLIINASYSGNSDVTVDILDDDGTTVLINNLSIVAGVGDLSGLSPAATADGIRVRVNLTQSGAVAPSVSDLQVSWNPISLLLLDKQAPATVLAGQTINYKLRYSVNFVQAENLVLWDELPSVAEGTVAYPAAEDYGQDDSATFVSATDGGQLCSIGGGCNINGTLVPENAVYWDIGTVQSGTTVAVSFAVKSPNGTINETTYDNQAHIDASNAASIDSNVTTTTILSTPAPNIQKRVSNGGIPLPNGNYFVFTGEVVQFTVSDPIGAVDGNDFAAEGRERMVNTVVYDDVSDLVGNIDSGYGTSGFNNISGGGTYVAAYTAPDGTGPFPAIVWNNIGLGSDSILGPGAIFNETFDVSILNTPAANTFSNAVCLDSDQTTPVCDNVTLETIPDESVTGIFAKGDDLNNSISAAAAANDDRLLSATYGGTYKYLLRINNTSLVTVTDVVMVDMIPTEVDLVAAYVPDATANATTFYTTTTAFTDPNTSPDIIPSTLPASIGGGWINWDTTPPTDPADVTWVAFHIPEVSPAFVGDGLHQYYAHFDVRVIEPALATDRCVGRQVDNTGLFHVYGREPFGGGANVPISLFAEDDEITHVAPDIATLNADLSSIMLSPDPASNLPSIVDYSVVVSNDIENGVAHSAANIRVELQWSTVDVNGIAQYLDFITAAGGTIETFDPSNGRVVINVGTLTPGASQTVNLELAIPAGVLDESQYSIDATVSGEPVTGHVCNPSSASASKTGTVSATPQLQVVKEDVLDIIPGGGSVEYHLTFNNIGDAPSTGTYIVDRVPTRMVFEYATGPNGEQVFVTNKTFPDVPLALSVLDQMEASDITTHFSPATYDAGTGQWTSPFGEETTWVAWLVDDQTLSPPQFAVNDTNTVSLFLGNDEDSTAEQVDSNDGVVIFNEAGIFSSELLQAIGNEVRTTIEMAPGLNLDKSGPGVVVAGADFDWTIEYYNNSGADDDVVIIEDVLPAGVSFVSAAHSWNAAAQANGASGIASGAVPSQVINNPDGTTTLIFRIADDYRGGDLASLEGGTLTITANPALAANGTFLTNVACGSATNSDGSTYICDEDTVELQNPDLWITKSADNPQPNLGDIVTYLIRISNEGGFLAENVVISDQLPSGVSYVGNLQVLTNGYTLSAPTVSGQQLTWSFANGNAIQQNGGVAGVLPANSGSIYFTYQVSIDSGASGSEFLNTVTTTTDTPELPDFPNSDTATVRIPFPDPAVNKTAPAFTDAGAYVNWSVNYLNNNNADAEGVYLLDTLPDWDGDDSVDVTFVSTNANGPGAVTVWYHANVPSNVPTFDISNPAAGGWVSDPSSIDVVHVAYAVGDLPRNSGPFSIEIVTQLINPDDSSLAPAGSALTNDVTIDSTTTDDDPTNNTDNATTRVPGLDMALTKSGSVEGGFPGTAPGQTIVYTIDYANTGPETAYGVKISDTLPAGVTYDSDSFDTVLILDETGNPIAPVDHDNGSAPYSTAVPVTTDINGSTITWYLGNNTGVSDEMSYRRVGIPSGASGSFQIIVTIDSDVLDGTLLENNATLITDRYDESNPAEEYLGNNVDDSSVSVYRTDVFVNKSVVDVTGDETWTEAGNILTYTIEYGNIGNIDAADVIISEIIPDGTSYVPSSLQVPGGSIASFSPNSSDPTSFDVIFQSPLPAPSTFFAQGTAEDWSNATLANVIEPGLFTGYQRFNDNDGDIKSSAVEIADLNGDGLMDIIIGNASPNVSEVLINDGNGGFLYTFKLDASNLQQMTLLDMDGDGDLDVVVVNSDEPVQIFENDGTGAMTEVGSIDPLNEYYDVAAIDVNSDGAPDLVFADHDINPVLFNDGSGNFSSDTLGVDHILVPSTTTIDRMDTFAVEAFDADGDGDLDVAVGNDRQNALYINNGDGTITVVDTFADDTHITGDFAAFDADGDGDLDIAVANGADDSEGFNELWLNDGAGNFTVGDAEAFGGENFTHAIAAFDADGDGDMDVVVGDGYFDGSSATGYDNELYLNDGAGNFTGATEFQDFGYLPTRDIGFVDANNDGLMDVVLAQWGNNELYLNSASIDFCPAIAYQDYDPGDTTSILSTGVPGGEAVDGIQFDADGDGILDIVLADWQQAVLFLNDGAGGYTDSEIDNISGLTPNRDIRKLEAIDIDGDDDLDVVVTTNGNGGNRVLLNDGAGVFTLAASAGDFTAMADAYTLDLISADIDNDGDLDIVINNSGVNLPQVLFNNGAGELNYSDGISGLTTLNTGFSNTFHIESFDADGDGDTDILVGGNASGSTTTELHINDGAGNFAVSTPFNGHAYSGTERPEPFDRDGDGDLDVFIVQYDTVYIYNNDGTGNFNYSSTVSFETCTGGDYLDSIMPVDLNHDGIADLVSGGESCDVEMRYGNADGTFDAPQIYTSFNFEEEWLFTDYDGDGDDDLVAVGADGSVAVYAYRGYEGPATVTSPLITPAATYPNSGALSSWNWLIIEHEIVDGTDITYDILDGSGTPIAGFTGLTPDATGRINLATLDVATYPAIYTRANLENDNTYVTPELCAWTTTYRMEKGAQFTFQVRVDDPATANPINNNVAIQTTTPEIDYDNNSDADSINVRMTDLEIEKAVSDVTALVGDTLTYTLTYHNNGPQTAVNAIVQDILPVGVSYVASSATPGTSAISGTGVAGDPIILTWDIGDLAVNAGGTITFQVTIDVGTEDSTLLNVTTIGNERQETTYTNNDDNVTTFVGNLTNVYITKDGPSTAGPGQTITYTLGYGNDGNADADDVSVSDILPTGVTFVSATPAETSQSGQTLTWSGLGTLAQGETGLITVTVDITDDPSIVGQQLHNVTTVSTSSEEVTQADNNDDHDNTVLITLASLSGYVWHDANEDVVFDASENGIEGVEIVLTGTDIFGIAITVTTTTDENGFYAFTGLTPGVYELTETQPVTYASTGAVVGSKGGTLNGDDAQNSITIESGDEGVRYDFGEDFGVSAGDYIWEDLDANGIQDDGAASGIENVLVYLYKDSDGDNAFTPGVDEYVGSDFTDADGYYGFDGLVDGDYVVQVAQSNFDSGSVLEGWANSPGSADPDTDDSNTDDNGIPLSGEGVVSTAISLTVGTEPITDGDTDDDSNLSVDFGFYQVVEIGNYVWLDSDRDGNSATGSNIAISSTLVTAIDALGKVYTGTTDVNGLYTITVPANATYTVTVPSPSGYSPSDTLISASSSHTDTDGLSHDGAGTIVTVGTDDNYTIDFGFYESVNIGSLVWIDSDNDGDATTGTITPVANVVVSAESSDGTIFTGTTDLNGIYTITVPATNTYTVTVATPVDTVPSGTLIASDSNPGANDNLSHDGGGTVITVGTLDDPTIDFGFWQPASLGNFVWDDLNYDGMQDGGESGIAGVIVELLDDAGTAITDSVGAPITATTTITGFYHFTDLISDTYTVRFSNLPPIYEWTQTDIITGTNGDAGDSDALPAGGVSSAATATTGPIVINAGDNNMTVDAGAILPPPGSLGNLVWYDQDRDGMQDVNEPGVPGITVTLFLANGLPVTQTWDLQPYTNTTTTDANGFYSFADLKDGLSGTAYYVKFTLPNGYGFTQQNTVTDTVDSDAIASGDNIGQTDIVTISQVTLPDSSVAGENNPTLDAGIYYGGSIGNRIWADNGAGANSDNGEIDSDESGIDGVIVNLLTSAGLPYTNTIGVPMTTTTANDGYYRFDGLLEGDYLVEVAASNFAPGGPLADYLSSTPTEANPNDDVDSNDNGIVASSLIRSGIVTLDGIAEPVETDLGPGGHGTDTVDTKSNLTVDFGFLPPVIIGNQVWIENDDDGNVATGTTMPVTNTLVTATASGGSVYTTTTDANGLYTITVPVSDTYVVTVDTPANTVPSGVLINSSSAPSDPDGLSHNGAGITVTVGYTNNTTIDFGFYEPVKIGSLVWLENDGDGDATNGTATPLDGIVVSAESPSGSIYTTTTDANGTYTMTVPGNAAYTVTVGTPIGTLPSGNLITASSNPGDADSMSHDGAGTLVTLGTVDNLTIDFGFTPQLGSIGDTIWGDLDDSGGAVTTTGDVPLEGVIVTLTDSTGAVLTATTTITGHYLFDGLPLGTYTVTVDITTLPAGYSTTPSFDPDGSAESQSTTTLTPAEPDDLDQDFSYTPVGSIGDTVWYDINSDGIQQSGETGIPNVVISLTTSAGAVITTTTGVSGTYLFENLPGDNYTVTVDTDTLPAGLIHTYDEDGGTANPTHETVVGLGIGVDWISADFGYRPTVQIGNYIWIEDDTDGNATTGATTPVSNTLITATADDGTVYTATTDASGLYTITVPAHAAYTITVSTPPAFVPSGTLLAADNDPATNNNMSHDGNGTVVTVTDVDNMTIDFGFTLETVEIGNYVWLESDNDGDATTNVTGAVSNTVVTATDSNGIVYTATTDANGLYTITVPANATYTVTVAAPTGYVASTIGATPGDNQNHDNSGAVVSVTNVDDYSIDFGFTPETVQIGNYVWIEDDTDGNAATGATTPVTNTVVTATASDGSVYTATTDANGLYTITVPANATYTVTVATPADHSPSGTLVTSSNNSADADGMSHDGAGTVVTVASDDNLTIDFGFTLTTVEIGNRIWTEDDGDGIADNDGSDVPVVSAVVTAIASDGSVFTATTDANGLYTMTVPANSTYTVTVAAPTGYLASTMPPSAGDNQNHNHTGEVVTVAEANDYTIDFGFTLETVEIGNRIWTEDDGDGVADNDGSDMPVVGAVVTTIASDGTVYTATTDANGLYTMTVPANSTYTVTVAAPDGYNPSTIPGTPDDNQNHNNSGTIVTVEEMDDLTIDFGFTSETVEIGNRIWTEDDGDGIADNDGSDQPVIGAVVTAIASDGSVFTATTDANGLYTMTVPANTTYTVTVAAPVGYFASIQPATPGDNQNHDHSGEVVVVTDVNDYSIDFGFTLETVEIGNYVWIESDTDGNAATGATTPVSNTVVTAVASDGTVYTTTTDASGQYTLTVPANATYTVTVSTPAGHNPSGTLIGSSSDPSDQDGMSHDGSGTVVTVGTESNPTIDFGFTSQLVEIGNRIWTEDDGNGVADDGGDNTQPVANVVVTAVASDGTVYTATTDADGFYTITVPANATYTVTVDAPAGYGSSTMPGTQSDNENHNYVGELVTVAESNITSIDFGFTPELVQIGNYVWLESDGDGIANNGVTTPSVGTVVTAVGSDGTVYTATTDSSGLYTITVPANATYTVTVSPPVGYIPSMIPATPGDNENHDGSGTVVVIGTSDDLTIDFAFTETPPETYAIGNLVWKDGEVDGSGAAPNGMYNAGVDTVADGVLIVLYEVVSGTVGTSPIMTTTTTLDGTYQFAGLPAGDYAVVIPFSEFAGSGALHDAVSGTSYTASPNGIDVAGDDDVNHNGNLNGALGVMSDVITLGGSQPTGEAAHGLGHAGDDANDDWTVDFAFFLPDPTAVGLLNGGASGTAVAVTAAAATTALLLAGSYVVVRRRRGADA